MSEVLLFRDRHFLIVFPLLVGNRPNRKKYAPRHYRQTQEQGATMAVDMFLKLGDIKGESRDQTHRDEIEISKWGWRMTQSGNMHSGTGGGAGKVNMGNLAISKALDKSTPNLMMACSTGKHYPEARLVVRKAGGGSAVEYLVITLKEVLVSSYETTAVTTSDVLTEEISLNFAKVEVSYQPQKSDGSKDGGAIKYGWNIRENIKI
jgi:type VI secretion system secreted protein Hcp